MIFESIKSSEFEKTAICQIIEHIDLRNFLAGSTIGRQVLTCPTNAIDVENKEVTDACIDCGICWIKYPLSISKLKGTPSLNLFKDYLKKDKKFIYRWLALCLDERSGIDIQSAGFSRVKRVPLIVKVDKNLLFFKSVHEIADIEKADYELDDIIKLIKDDIKEYHTRKIIIVINEIDKSFRNGHTVISFNELYNKIINQHKRKIMEILS